MIKAKHPADELVYAPGGLLSSVEEFSNYIIASINKGKYKETELLNPELMEEMQKIHVERTPGPYGREGYGYGWGIIENFLGTKLVAHGGSTGVSSAYAAFIPELKIGAVMMNNTGGFPYTQIAHGIFAILMGKDPKKTIPLIKIEEKLNMLTGTYKGYGDITRMKILNRGGLLYLEMNDELSQLSIPIIPEDIKLETLEFYTITNGKKEPVEFRVKSPSQIDVIIERNLFHKIRS